MVRPRRQLGSALIGVCSFDAEMRASVVRVRAAVLAWTALLLDFPLLPSSSSRLLCLVRHMHARRTLRRGAEGGEYSAAAHAPRSWPSALRTGLCVLCGRV